jgi:hypothetical protein
MGVLSMEYFPEYDTLYFSEGLEQYSLFKVDSRKKIELVNCPSVNF